MKVFISGGMTGLPQFNRPAFESAERALSSCGHTVLSPANHIPLVNPEAITHQEYLSICYAMISCCDAVYFLDGWEDSKGSRLEMQYAIKHNKELRFERGEITWMDWDTCNH